MTAGAIRQNVAYDGQRYFDEPVYVEVSKAKPLALSINRLFQRPARLLVSEATGVALAVNSAYGKPRMPIARRIEQVLPATPRIEASITALSHYERTRLRWMMPDGKGGLVPKYDR